MTLRFPFDPFANREHQKYPHPIPSREYIIWFLLDNNKSFSFEELLKKLKLSDSDDDREALTRRLDIMVLSNQIAVNRHDEYHAPKNLHTKTGKVIAHRNGFGFLAHDVDEKDIFLPPNEMSALMHGDKVIVALYGNKKTRSQAMVLKILEHAQDKIVGVLQFDDFGAAYVRGQGNNLKHDIAIMPENIAGATEGSLVNIEIIHHPQKGVSAQGRIIEILGNYMDPGLEVETAIRNYKIPYIWPQEVEKEVKKIKVAVSAKDISKRQDLRPMPFVTIDGEDAKDFDDAVYCCKKEDGSWCLYVAIADVSHFVQENSALDKEAILRGNSTYFPSKVIPMLPEILSNDACSLKPDVDRLTLVCEMHINQQGECEHYDFYRAVIHSHARLTYTQVAKIIEQSCPEAIAVCSHVLPEIYNLHELYNLLLKVREERGAIDFATTETRIMFADDMKIEKIVPVYRNTAHKIIEECMLLANESAAKYVLANKITCLFRNHEPPPQEKLSSLKTLLQDFGLKLNLDKKLESKDYARLVNSIAERDEHRLLNTVLLRSLSQACYEPSNKGHFGLAYAAYTHFTSPIRRYSDLLLHRAIGQHLAGKAIKHAPDFDLNAISQHISTTERRSDDAVRDTVTWLKCEYMQSKLGETYSAIITGVTSFGLFVEAEDIFIEGLVHIATLHSDHFHYDSIRHTLVGELSGVQYRLGDKVYVQVASVNIDDRKIEFSMLEGRTDKKPKKKRNKKKKSRQKDK